MFEDDRMPAVNFAPVMKQLIDAAKAQHEAIDILFAMLIEVTRSDALRETRVPFMPSESGRPWAALLQGQRAVATADAYMHEVHNEAELEEAARTKMRDILHATANVLKGDPGPLKLHSWHDLPEVAARMMDEARMRITVDGVGPDA